MGKIIVFRVDIRIKVLVVAYPNPFLSVSLQKKILEIFYTCLHIYSYTSVLNPFWTCFSLHHFTKIAFIKGSLTIHFSRPNGYLSGPKLAVNLHRLTKGITLILGYSFTWSLDYHFFLLLAYWLLLKFFSGSSLPSQTLNVDVLKNSHLGTVISVHFLDNFIQNPMLCWHRSHLYIESQPVLWISVFYIKPPIWYFHWGAYRYI